MYSRGSGTDTEDDGWQARGLRLADECRQDLRSAVRDLYRQPGFSVAATLTLGLGLGLAIGLFTVVDAVLLRPLPFADQDELVVMWERDDSIDNPHIEVSLPNFEDWRAQAESFADMAAMGSTTWGDVEVQEVPRCGRRSAGSWPASSGGTGWTPACSADRRRQRDRTDDRAVAVAPARRGGAMRARDRPGTTLPRPSGRNAARHRSRGGGWDRACGGGAPPFWSRSVPRIFPGWSRPR